MIPLLAATDIIEHLADHQIFGPYFTVHDALFLLVAIVMFVWFTWMARHMKDPPAKTGLTTLAEVGLIWVRDEIVYPWLGEEKGSKYLFFYWTLFFFILVSNGLGLLPFPFNPFGKTATGNVWITGALAVVTYFFVHIAGIRQHGAHYWAHIVPGGTPVYLWPFMWLLEFTGLIVKSGALAIRLFANMTAGHAVLAVIYGSLLGIHEYANLAAGGAVTLIGVGYALFITLFEVLVILIQAYLFTVLTAVFVGLAVAEEH